MRSRATQDQEPTVPGTSSWPGIDNRRPRCVAHFKIILDNHICVFPLTSLTLFKSSLVVWLSLNYNIWIYTYISHLTPSFRFLRLLNSFFITHGLFHSGNLVWTSTETDTVKQYFNTETMALLLAAWWFRSFCFLWVRSKEFRSQLSSQGKCKGQLAISIKPANRCHVFCGFCLQICCATAECHNSDSLTNGLILLCFRWYVR